MHLNTANWKKNGKAGTEHIMLWNTKCCNFVEMEVTVPVMSDCTDT